MAHLWVQVGRVGGPCRPPVFCLKASPKVKGRETGEFAPLGAPSVSGDKKDRGREAPPPSTPTERGRDSGCRGRRGPRGPALSPPSLASPSDVGRTGHGSFSCGCHTRSLRPLTSGCGLQSGRSRDVAFCFELPAPRGRERPQPGAPTHEPAAGVRVRAAGVRARPRARPRCGRPSRSPLAHQAVRVAA